MPSVLARYIVVTANFATAGWRTFGLIRRRRIARMTRALFAQNPDLGSISEAAWRKDVRDAIIAAAPDHYGFTLAQGSVLVFWNRRRFVVEQRSGRVAHGQVVAGGDYISDKRVDRVLVYRDRRNGRRLKHDAFHWAPIRPALGADAERAGHAAQAEAIAGLLPPLGRGPLLKVGTGDPNNHSPFIGTEVNGRDVDYAGDTIPDRIFCVDGEHVAGSLGNVRYFDLPGGDHYRGRTKTGRRRAVGLAATLTVRTAA